MAKDIHRESLRPWQLGAGLALLGIVGSVFLASQQVESARQVEQERFVQAANATTDALVRRIDAYTEIALGLRGLFTVNPALNRRAFMAVVSQLEVDTRYPGIKNIAFTRYVTAAQKTRFELQVRADTSVEAGGYPGFAIHPPGERPEYFVADYLWPDSGNRGIQGLDISAQPVNLASMHYAQQSGKTLASAPFDLIQETTHRAGFVIRVPVFRNTLKSIDSPPRAPDFLGSVAVTLRVFDLFQQLQWEGYLQGLALTMTDRGATFDSVSGDLRLPLFSTPETGVVGPGQHRREVVVYGRKWQLDFQPGKAFLSETERSEPLLVGLGGGLISLLLGTLVFLLALGRSQALALAAASDEELKDSESRWRFAIEGAGDGLWDWNLRQGTVFFSTHWKEMLGYAEGEIGHHLDEWSRRVHPDDQAQAMADLKAHLDGASPLFVSEHRIGCRDGSWKWVLDRGVVLSRDALAKPLRMIGTQSDITERKRTEAEILATKTQLEAMLAGIPIPFFIKDANSRFLLMNRACEVQWGMKLSDLYGTDAGKFFPPLQMARFLAMDQQVFESRQAIDFEEMVWSNAYKEDRQVHTYRNPTFDRNGSPLYLVCATIDVTLQKQAEQALKTLLREKEALLKEVHHRVKNNLQVITSLLRLESRRSRQPDVKTVLDEMQARIHSMALLHESLYRSGTFASVDLGAYLKNLATQAFRFMAHGNRVVQLQLALEALQVGMDQAIACGLLVNELISNCFKHSFPEGGTGEVCIALQPTSQSGMWRLRVSDTGAGLPADFEERRKTSLGLQLVSDLANQLGGTLTIDSMPGQGATFTVLFKAQEPAALEMP